MESYTAILFSNYQAAKSSFLSFLFNITDNGQMAIVIILNKYAIYFNSLYVSKIFTLTKCLSFWYFGKFLALI